ncbi:hypothetical protein BC2926_38720 [Bacillus cereus]|nr:hypothetical protein BC2926_38720 [Bacillus cereus]
MAFKLPFGLKNGDLVHVSEVERGLKCNCVCPSCGHQLTARKGKKTSHHFAHNKGKECEYGLETTLHLAAKQILEKHKRITLPQVSVGYIGNIVISNSKEFIFDEVSLEKRTGNIVPDVVLYVKGVPLFVEITVTHEIDEKKRKKIEDLGISVLEIDLSKADRDLSIEELEKIIIDETQGKRWIYNRKEEEVLQKLINIGEKVVLKSGSCPFERGGYRAEGEPVQMLDCWCCVFCAETTIQKDHVTVHTECFRKTKIRSYQDFLRYKKSEEDNGR